MVYEYDGSGNLVKETNPAGGAKQYTYDCLNRITKITDEVDHSSIYEYDASGNMTKYIDASGSSLTYTSDAMGRVITQTDALGQVTGITDAFGNTTAFTYTADGRIPTVTDALGNTTAYEYDGNGNLMSVTDALGSQTAFEYDALNNCIREYRDAGEEKACITLYQYDKRSCMIKEINSLSEERSYSCDGNGNLTEIVDEEQNHIVVTYDLNNLPTSIRYGTDKTVNYRCNSRGQLVKMLDWIVTTVFTRDILGRLTKVKDPDGRENVYEYDAMGNRTGILYRDGSRSAFAYDKNDRPTALSRQFGETIRVGEQITYDALGRITQHNSTSDTPECARSRSYLYDALGHLATYSDGENTETYLYDTLGNRTAKHLNDSPPLHTSTMRSAS